MKSNIQKAYILSFLFGLMFFYGIERLFLFSLGVEQIYVSLILVLSALTVMLFDIPLGSMADRLGRKNTFIFANICLTSAIILFASSDGWEQYAIGTVLHGLFLVGISGTSQAFIYDTLETINRKAEYAKIVGRLMALSFTGIGVGVFSSGLLAEEFGFRFNYWASLVSCFLAFIVIFSLSEPTLHKMHKIRTISEHIKISIKTITLNPTLKLISVIFPVLGLIMWVSNSYSQFIFNDFKISLTFVSVNSTLALIAGVGGRLIAHKFQENTNILLFVNLTLLAIIGFGPKLVVLFALILMFGVNSILLNNIDTQIQHLLSANLRATATSTYTALGSFVAVVVGLCVSISLTLTNILVIFRYIFIFCLAVSIYWYIKSRTITRLDTTG